MDFFPVQLDSQRHPFRRAVIKKVLVEKPMRVVDANDLLLPPAKYAGINDRSLEDAAFFKPVNRMKEVRPILG